MKLYRLLARIGCETAPDLPDTDITLVTGDSRRVLPGTLFVALKGERFDGHDYAGQALEKGACAVLTERDLGLERQIVVPGTRAAYALLCAELSGNPADKLKLIAVTGTNGKTTITYLLKQVLESMGKKTGLIGTIHVEIGDMELPAKHTTPDPAELHALLGRMVAAGCEYVVMEASSHALDQHRLEGCAFEAGIFTNLTQDHLDYHRTMENYYNAKKKLFEQCRLGVINLDDEYGVRLLAEIGCETVTYSAQNDLADYTAKSVEKHRSGVNFAFVGKSVIERVAFCMPGSFSVSNAMAAAACLVSIGFEPSAVAQGLNACTGVKGRAEVLYAGKDFTVLCDYAHSPDGLEKVLAAVREFAPGRVVALFGCAGNRDRTKRTKMTRAVGENCDFAILTSDNPRNEDPMQIINDALPGFEGTGAEHIVIVDRYEAIRWALENARQDDVLVLCGKGHEDYQVLNFGTVLFDEHEIVKRLIEERDQKAGRQTSETEERGAGGNVK